MKKLAGAAALAAATLEARRMASRKAPAASLRWPTRVGWIRPFGQQPRWVLPSRPLRADDSVGCLRFLIEGPPVRDLHRCIISGWRKVPSKEDLEHAKLHFY